jgi:hypothetical protein
MRTSLNEIKSIEGYLHDQLSSAEKLSFEVAMSNDAMLRLNVFLQRKVYALLKHYDRQSVRKKVEAVHDKLFNDPHEVVFRESIQKIFKS